MPAELDTLATIDDYTDRYGSVADGSVLVLVQRLIDASAAVRSYTGLQFTAGETTQVLRVVAGKVRLPQRPVVSVDAVDGILADNSRTTLVGWTFDGIDQLAVGSQSFVLNLPEAWYDTDNPFTTVEVTWTYGYDEIPADIVAIVCAAAGRAINAPSGVISETIGSYSYRLADDEGAGPIGFSTPERGILDRYRRRQAALQT